MQDHVNMGTNGSLTTERLLIALLRAVLCGTQWDTQLTFEQFKSVHRLADTHDLAHLVYVALEQSGTLPPAATPEEQAFLDEAAEQVISVQYRYAKLDAEMEHISTVFEREGIDYMPLKGAVLRVMYPEPWMRTSCDIDILVREPDLDRAVTALVAEGFETDGVRNHHDVLLKCDGVNLELHHNLLERMPQSDAVLCTVWDHTVNRGHYFVDTPAFFVYHHFAHMAHHVLCGGCGVRTVMDLWLLVHNSQCSASEVLDLCRKGGLDVFAEQVCTLAEVWFGDGEPIDGTEELARFILRGGVFGSETQRYASSAARHGKRGMAKRVIFMPYEDLKHVYPQLDGKPHLTPYYQCCRICTRLRQGRGKGAVDRIRKVGKQTDEAVAQMQTFLTSLGLHRGTEGEA